MLSVPFSAPSSPPSLADNAAREPELAPVTVPSSADAQRIHRLVDEARLLEAASELSAWSAPERWTSAVAMGAASRTIAYLGAPERSTRLALAARRRFPDQAIAHILAAIELLAHRGPYVAIEALLHAPACPDPEVLQDRLLLEAEALAQLGDFGRAGTAIDEAARMRAPHPRLELARSQLLRRAHRFEEALELARSIFPAPSEPIQDRSWKAVFVVCDLLEACEGAEAAAAYLAPFERRIPVAEFSLRLARLHVATGSKRVARAALERCVERSPFLSPRQAANIRALRDRCESSRSRNAARRRSGRLLIDVPMVAQRRDQCGPVALAALGRHAHAEADADAIARAISDGGTTPHAQRAWAESQGWLVREFTFELDVARRLLAMGIPIGVIETECASSHMMVLCGYDPARGTLLFRDPSGARLREAKAEAWVSRQRPYGPRCLVVLPSADRAREVEPWLPEARMFDQLHELERELSTHRRDRALDVLERLTEEGASRRWRLWAERAIALHDGDEAEILRTAEALLEVDPGDERSRWYRAQVFGAVRGRARQIALLELEAQSPSTPPALVGLLAQLLAHDARHAKRAARLARRVLRRSPGDGRALATLAMVAEATGQRDQAVTLYRLASCANPLARAPARAYFAAAQVSGRGDEALAWLSERADRLGTVDAGALETWLEAAQECGRTEAATYRLEGLLERPLVDRGPILLVAARWFLELGQTTRAAALIREASTSVPRAAYEMARVDVELARGRFASAAARLRVARARGTSTPELFLQLAECAARLEGDAERHRVLAEAIRYHPQHRALAHAWFGSLRAIEPIAERAAIERWLTGAPTDNRARLRLALLHASRGRVRLATQLAERITETQPGDGAAWAARAEVLEHVGDYKGASEAYKRGLELDVDQVRAARRWLSLGPDYEGYMLRLEQLRRWSKTRSRTGRAVSVWFEAASGRVCVRHLLDDVRDLRRARPDLVSTWTAEVRTLLMSGRAKDASVLATKARARLPSSAELVSTLALVARATGDEVGERAALQLGIQVAPTPESFAAMASFLLEGGRSEPARSMVEDAIARCGPDTSLLVMQARLDAQEDGMRRACARMLRAARADPDNTQAWETLLAWSHTARAKKTVADELQQQLRLRAHDARLHRLAARVLCQADQPAAAVQAAQRAIALDPTHADGYDTLAVSLCAARRFDEALDACEPRTMAPGDRVALQGRRAWVLEAMGDRNEATAQMVELVRRWPSFLWGHVRLASWFSEAGRPARALRLLERALRLEPAHTEARIAAGEACLACGDTERALVHFQRLLEAEPAHPGAVHGLVLAARASGARKGEAPPWLSQLERRDPAVGGSVRLGHALACADRDAAELAMASIASRRHFHAPLFEAALERLFDDDPIRTGRLLWRLACDPRSAPAVALRWSQEWTESGELPPLGDLAELLSRDPEKGDSVLASAIETAAKTSPWSLFTLWLRFSGRLGKLRRSRAAMQRATEHAADASSPAAWIPAPAGG